MLRPYWKLFKIATTIAMIAANERKASRFRLATFLATVAILRTFQNGRLWPRHYRKGLLWQSLTGFWWDMQKFSWCRNLTTIRMLFDCTIMVWVVRILQQKMGYFLIVRELLGLVRISYIPVAAVRNFWFFEKPFHCGWQTLTRFW